MKIRDRIRERLTARTAEARTQYWSLLRNVPDGAGSERAAAEFADQIEVVMHAVGKNADDVQSDIEDLVQLRAATGLASQHQKDRALLKEAAMRGAEVEAKARSLELKALDMRKDHAAVLHSARVTAKASEGALAIIRQVQRRLAESGFPEALSAVAEAGRQQESDRIQACLRTIDTRMSDISKGTDEGSQSRVRMLRLERASLQAQLDGLRGGAGDSEDVDIDSEVHA
jgi:hypothetical protein